MAGYQSPYTGAQIDAALALADTALQPGDVDDTPVNGETDAPVSSNWAFDHAANLNAHGISDFGETLVDDADAAAARTTLGAASDDLDNITLSRPSIRPSLLLDFANAKTLDPRITFTRDAVATYYDGKTTAKAEENLFTNSESPYVFSAGGSGATLSNGVWSFASSSQYIVRTRNFNVNSGVTFTVSATVSGSGAVRFHALSGVGNAQGPVTITLTETPTRYSITYTNDASGDYTGLRFSGAADGSPASLTIANVQYELRNALTAYTPTTSQPITNYLPVLQSAAANVARFDHDPITGESKGLLIEEQRTNLLTYSEDFSNAAWTKNAVSITINTIVSTDGTLTGDKVVENATTDAFAVARTELSFTASNTFLVYAKAGERRYVIIRAFASVGNYGNVTFDLQTGTITQTNSVGVVSATGAITPVGNGWHRISSTVSSSSSTAINIVGVLLSNTGTPTFSTAGVLSAPYSGDGYSGIYIWGAQLEAGSFPTSYIKTEAAQVTRAADAASMTGTNFSSWFNNAEGSFYASLNAKALAVSSGIQANDNSTNNRLRLALASTSDQGTVTTSGTAQATLDGGTPAVDTATKLTLGYKVNDFGLSLNGGTIATDTSGTIPVVNQLQLGAETTTVGNLHLKKVAYWPKKLTSAELVALTA